MPRISRRPKLSFTQKDLDYLIKLSHSRNQAASIVDKIQASTFELSWKKRY